MDPQVPAPVVLKLAPMPRTQVGPFLILGVPKDADPETVEAAWAERIKLARKGLIPTPLEDINWAREVISNRDARLRAEASTLNVDTTDSVLQKLSQRARTARPRSPGAQPLDVEKWLADVAPPVDLPDLDEVRAAIRPPPPPLDLPAVRVLVEQAAAAPLDPWEFPVLDLPDAPARP